jgi:hypothetical protein
MTPNTMPSATRIRRIPTTGLMLFFIDPLQKDEGRTPGHAIPKGESEASAMPGGERDNDDRTDNRTR